MHKLLTFLCFMLMFSVAGNAKLVFDSFFPGTFIIDDGTNFTQLMPNSSKPNWSPDGEHIAFTHGGYIWTIDTDGNNARQLLPTQQDVEITVQECPRWSPDGQQILFTQSEYITQQIGKGIDFIHIAHRYMICERNGENIQELQIPKNLEPAGIDWMDNGESVVFCGNKTELNKIVFEVILDYTIYKYHIATEKITQIGDDQVEGYSIDWVSGSALPVSPKSKMQTQWGEIKKAPSGSDKE